MTAKSWEAVGAPHIASAVIVIIIISPEDREIDVLRPFSVLYFSTI